MPFSSTFDEENLAIASPTQQNTSTQMYWYHHYKPHYYCHTLYKKDLNNPDNHRGVITHLLPDILECEVKLALGRPTFITTKKAGGGDGIPVELFQILKDDAVKHCTQYASKFGIKKKKKPTPHSAVATGLKKLTCHHNPKERQ